MNNQQTSPGCRVCGSEEVEAWLSAKEMMFGLRDSFLYYRCAHCECLQIETVAEDTSRYYPPDYYSFRQLPDTVISWKSRIKRKLLSPMMSRHIIGWGSNPGRLLCKIIGSPRVPTWMHFLPKPVPFDGGILDIGCGSGHTLLDLHSCGFTNLHGVDPYISESISYNCGIQIQKCELGAVQGKYSLIMLHHVLEHLEHPLDTLIALRNLLEEGGQILVRIPISDSHAAEKYKENWVQMDAPRHITLQTRKSMSILAEKAGLGISHVSYDSCNFQFWGSELYIRDIPLSDPQSQAAESGNGLFSPEILRGYDKESAILNNKEQGDQAAFVLIPVKKYAP